MKGTLLDLVMISWGPFGNVLMFYPSAPFFVGGLLSLPIDLAVDVVLLPADCVGWALGLEKGPRGSRGAEWEDEYWEEPEDRRAIAIDSALRTLKAHTESLWTGLVRLDQHRRDCSAQVREPTLRLIESALVLLSSAGCMTVRITPASVARDGEAVLQVKLVNVTEEVRNLVAQIAKERERD